MFRKTVSGIAALLLLSPITLVYCTKRTGTAAMSSDTSSTKHHIALLGDSILDNKSYTRSKPSVIEQLRDKVTNRGWNATLCAVDGDVIKGVKRQLTRVPSDATALVLSVGGNDGLHELGKLGGLTGWSIYNPLTYYSLITDFTARFRQSYSTMLDEVLQLKKPLVVCTIYYPQFDGGLTKYVSNIGLYFTNGIITDEAKKRGVPVIALHEVFDDPKDYANPIEPSAFGGDKITNNIIHILDNHPFHQNKHVIYREKTYSADPTGLIHGKQTYDRGDGGSHSSVSAQNAGFRAGM